MTISPASNAFIYMDHVCDYIPVVSTVSNLIDLFQKSLLRCFKKESTTNHYYKYLADKSFVRCLFLLIPVLGVIIVAIFNYFSAKKIFNRAEELTKGNTEEQLKEASSLYQQASDLGHLEASCKLAKCYKEGRGVIQSPEKAVEIYQLAAANDSSEAKYRLGMCYDEGSGVAKDPEKAATLIKQAAKRGHGTSNYQIGKWRAQGHSQFPQDLKEAVKYYRKADEADHLEGTFSLAECYFNGQGIQTDQNEAVKLYKKAAEKDHIRSLIKMAQCHEEGLGGLPKNPEEAKKCRDKAAELHKNNRV